MSPAPRQGQLILPIDQIVSAPTWGQAETDHETLMIDSLREHIRSSLTGVPDNLPELKGLCAKMPDPYEGKDDFDRLERWLSRLTTLWQAVGNDLMFEVEVIDPKDNQGDIQEEDSEIKAKVLNNGG